MERRKTMRKNGETHRKKHNNVENKENETENKTDILKQTRRFELCGIFLCLVAALSVLGIFGINAGFVGAKLASLLKYFFGVGALLSSSVLLLIGLYFITEHKNLTFNLRFCGFLLLFLLFLTFYNYLEIPATQEFFSDNLSVGGGLFGAGIAFILYKCFGETGSGIVIFAGLIASVLMITNLSLGDALKITREKGAIYAAKGFAGALFALVSVKKHIDEKREKKKEEPFVEANLYDQDTDLPELKKDYDDPAQKYIMSFMDGTQEPIKAETEPVADNVDNADNVANTDNNKQYETPKRKIVSYWEEDNAETIENAETNIAVIDEIATEPSKSVAEEFSSTPQYSAENETTAPATVPLSKRNDTGLGENGFEVRSDAFRSRDEIPAFSQNEETDKLYDIDLSNPDFDDNDYQNKNTADNMKSAYKENSSYETMSSIPQKSEFSGATASLRENTADKQKVEPPPQKPYELPEVTHILSKTEKKQNLALKIEIEDNARTLSKTLDDFKVKANIINACHGPAVTRYELEPAPGVKVSKITGLSEDLALALAATSIRIEPIPGKSAIGVEVPNKELEGVQLREVLEQPFFKDAASKLTVGLGMDIGGQAIFADLAKMPHLLIAGATGSGKSVCVNTLITSILFKAKPDEVKFILIDPKMVELSNYNGIPHLMVPVVTDAKKAASVLNWAVQEMEKRYSKFAEKVVRNMETYNLKFPEDKMSAIVIIIDELADLMMVAPHDVEDAICRLAQKARAAGIHLVLATQRPSVDVITGIIKANIPSRIAFAVSSQVDSRTILDSSGAEKLLGRGDMLFYPIGSPKPRRVQGAFVSDEEVEMLLDFIKGQGQKMETNEEIINFTEQAMLEDDKGKGRKDDAPRVDELLTDAVELVISTDQASASNIQRRFRVGYARAGRLIDTMEMLGIVGSSNGSKPRDILMSMEDALDAVQNLQE